MNNWFPALSGLSSAADAGSAASDTQTAADIATLQTELAQSQSDLSDAQTQLDALQASTALNLTADDERRLRNDYVILAAANSDHEDAMESFGVQVTAGTHAGYVNRPTCLKRDGNNILISQYYHKPAVLNPDGWSMLEQIPITYQSSTTSNEGIAYSYGCAIDRANNRIAICSWARHCVRVYALDTQALLYTIGTPGSAGNLADNKLYYAATAEFNPTTGNLYVVSYYGKGDDGEGGQCTNHGHISEFDGATGAFIATRQGFKGSGTPSGGYIYRPIDAFLDVDGVHMWVSVYGRNQLAKLDTTTTGADGYWPIVDYILPPAGQTLTNPWGICQCADGDLAIIVKSENSIIKLDPVTKAVTQKIDLLGAGLAGDGRRIIEVEPGILAYTDWSALGVCVVPTSGEITAQFATSALAAGWVHDSTDEGFDPDTGVLTKAWSTATTFPTVIKQCMREA